MSTRKVSCIPPDVWRCAYETSIEQAMLAGLLHDCAKCIPDDEKLQICEEHDIPINAVEYESPFLLHAKLGAYLAATVYEVKDPEILHAIEGAHNRRAGYEYAR